MVSIDTGTRVATFDRAHKLNTVDVVGLMGSDIGSGGGLTEIKAYADTPTVSPLFFCTVTSTTGKLYNSKVNATTCGASGLYIPATGFGVSQE